jgi:hypothetical protein
MTLNNSPVRQYVPAIGSRVKLALWEHYSAVQSQHPEFSIATWGWLTVRDIIADNAHVEYYNAGDTGIFFSIPLACITPPIGWQPRYTIHCKPEKVSEVMSWFARGIAVRQSHDMSGSMPTAFQPLTDGKVPDSPHWQFPETTDIIPASDCPRLIRVVQVEREEITNATLGYPPDPNCTRCAGTGRRTIAQLAEARNETVERTWTLIDSGAIANLDNLITDGHHSAFDTFRCHCTQYGALSRMGRTKRAKLLKVMQSDGWTVEYKPYAGGYWERTRFTTVKDWQ